mmetsp:Transcript_26486/g.50317  ORF Transcript_26486/g.50317 Transcript_26486/m.50317 type:complete len:206 (-) Transcript_26486:1712-2329(-)
MTSAGPRIKLLSPAKCNESMLRCKIVLSLYNCCSRSRPPTNKKMGLSYPCALKHLSASPYHADIPHLIDHQSWHLSESRRVFSHSAGCLSTYTFSLGMPLVTPGPTTTGCLTFCFAMVILHGSSMRGSPSNCAGVLRLITSSIWDPWARRTECFTLVRIASKSLTPVVPTTSNNPSPNMGSEYCCNSLEVLRCPIPKKSIPSAEL